MNLSTHRVIVGAVVFWGCLLLSAQQTPTPAPSDQTVSPTTQPAAPPESAQEPPASPDDSKPPSNPNGPTPNGNAPFTIQQTVRLVVLDMVVILKF